MLFLHFCIFPCTQLAYSLLYSFIWHSERIKQHCMCKHEQLRAINALSTTREQALKRRRMIQFLRHFHWLKLHIFFPHLNYSCAFYLRHAVFTQNSPSTWCFLFRWTHIHIFFYFYHAAVQHKKSKNICRAVIFNPCWVIILSQFSLSICVWRWAH